jgi:hypothetical protein
MVAKGASLCNVLVSGESTEAMLPVIDSLMPLELAHMPGNFLSACHYHQRPEIALFCARHVFGKCT